MDDELGVTGDCILRNLGSGVEEPVFGLNECRSREERYFERNAAG